MVVVTRVGDDGVVQPPLKPDGSYHRFEMVTDTGRARCYADTPTQLLEYLVDGYELADEEQRLGLRIRHAVDTQTWLQAGLLAGGEAGDLHDTQVQMLNRWAGGRPPDVDVWSGPVPLVCVDAWHAPHTGTPRPVGEHDYATGGNVWWLTPAAGEHEYLASLHDAGVIGLHQLATEVS